MLFGTVVLKNPEMFQENTDDRGLQILRMFYLINIKQIRKHINIILHTQAIIWHFILPE